MVDGLLRSLAWATVVGIGRAIGFLFRSWRKKRQQQRRRELMSNVAVAGLVVGMAVLVVLAVKHARSRRITLEA